MREMREMKVVVFKTFMRSKNANLAKRKFMEILFLLSALDRNRPEINQEL